MVILPMLLALVLFLAPLILAIAALLRVKTLEGNLQKLPQLVSRIHALEQRLARIEERLGPAKAGPPAVATPPPPVEVRQPAPPAAAAPPKTPPAASPSLPFATPEFRLTRGSTAEPESHLDLETLIAGRWLNRVGILALLFSVSFFLKYAFENNWVGPRGRVAIGILLGAAMLPWNNWLLGRGYKYFSEGIAGLGEAVLYLSLWAGWHYYSLFSQPAAFARMIVVTGAMVGVALGRNSQRIALLALTGGFLTPQLVSTGTDQQFVLFTYLAILGGAMLFLSSAHEWLSLAPVSFFATQLYLWGWYFTFYSSAKLERTLAFASLFFLLYTALPVLRARRGRRDALDTLLVLLNSFLYLVALRVLLWPEYRWTLTMFLLGLAAVHLVLARALRQPKEAEPAVTRLLFAGLALTFVTLAIPARLDGKWMTLALAIEGAVLVWSGIRARSGSLRAAGYLLLLIPAFRLIFFPIPAKQFLLNARFFTFAVLVACFVAALLAARKAEGDVLDGNERGIFALFGVGANAYALLALSLEFWDAFGRAASLELDRGLAQHLSLSVLWTAYATALILLGVRRQSAALRWQALALFGLVVAKVFLFDLSFLERFYRIFSFLALGLVLLVVSFLYQRKVTRERSEP